MWRMEVPFVEDFTTSFCFPWEQTSGLANFSRYWKYYSGWNCFSVDGFGGGMVLCKFTLGQKRQKTILNYSQRHTTLSKALRECRFSDGSHGSGFLFYFNIHGLLDQAFRIQVWNSQLGLCKCTLCFYAFLLPFPFILLSCFPSLAVKPPRLRKSCCTPASCLFSPRLCFQGIVLKQGGVESQTADLSQSVWGPGRAHHVSAAACGSLSVCTTHTGWRRRGADFWPRWVGYQRDRINTVLRQNSHIPVF